MITTFDNGLRVAADEMTDVESVSIGVFVNTGSRNEDKKVNGISHFLEHMAFKGTQKRSAKEIAEEFEGIGGSINAYTSREKTVYYVKVLKKHAEFAVEFLSDILQNSTFDEVELEKERGVILQEIAMTNDTPDDIVFDYFQETAYPNQAYGRSILGPKSNIKKFQASDFKDYIFKQYNYSDIAIAAAGNIKQDDLVKWSKKYFNNLSNGKQQEVELSKYVGGEFKKHKNLEQVNLVLGFDGISYLDDDYYKSQILSMILGGGMSSRLFQHIREELGLAYSIYSFNQGSRDSGIFSIYAGTTPEKVSQLLDATNVEIKKICEGIHDKELNKVKTQFEASLLMAKESTSTRMQKLGNNILNKNRVIHSEEIIEKINAIQKTEIVDLAGKIFTKSKPTFAMVGKVKDIEINYV
ncbi:MAG: insulinase family protein [Rickettsiales bacterium]|nr:insulinase family protein [Rickettsiales bacterium]